MAAIQRQGKHLSFRHRLVGLVVGGRQATRIGTRLTSSMKNNVMNYANAGDFGAADEPLRSFQMIDTRTIAFWGTTVGAITKTALLGVATLGFILLGRVLRRTFSDIKNGREAISGIAAKRPETMAILEKSVLEMHPQATPAQVQEVIDVMAPSLLRDLRRNTLRFAGIVLVLAALDVAVLGYTGGDRSVTGAAFLVGYQIVFVCLGFFLTWAGILRVLSSVGSD